MCVTAAIALYAFLLADFRSARALVQRGEMPAALQQIERILRAAPNDPEVLFQAGELLREIGTERAARLLQLAPDSAEAHELLGRSLASRRQLDEALAEFRAALLRNPAAPGLHFLIGDILWKQRDFEAARPELEAELQRNPNHALANLRLGDVLLSLNEPGLAAAPLLKAVAANGDAIEAHRSLGRAYRALGRHRDALQQFQIVAERRPNDDSAHAQLAGEYRALGDPERAKAELAIHRRLLEAKAVAARKD